jgi:hypothetical protein
LRKVKDTQASRTSIGFPAAMGGGTPGVPHKAAPGTSAPIWWSSSSTDDREWRGSRGSRHYFLTAVPEEATSIDNGGSGPGGSAGRTSARGTSGQRPARRRGRLPFYARVPNSHFYTANAGECQSLRDANPTNDPALGWSYEGIAFHTVLPAFGNCAAGYYPVYRSYNNRFSPTAAQNDGNHRITPSYNDYQRSIRFFGFLDEGVVFCAPASPDAGADLQATQVYPGPKWWRAHRGSGVPVQQQRPGQRRRRRGPCGVAGGGDQLGGDLPVAQRRDLSRQPQPGSPARGQPLATWPGRGIKLTATGTVPPPRPTRGPRWSSARLRHRAMAAPIRPG